jgi:hypothetical protein
MSDQYETIFATDGRHSSVYIYEPPMDVRQYVEPIDEVVDLGIDTISYVVGDCSVLLYDTKVGERWGHNLDLAEHIVFYRAAQNCEAMIRSGHDPLMVVCEHAQLRGFSFLPHLLLNMFHTPRDRVTNGRAADFTMDHPEWQVGEEPEYPEAEFDLANRLSYAVPEVRQNRLAVIRELVSDYPTDGVELNFSTYAPFIARREVAGHTETLTEWMRQIRRTCDEAAAAQERPKRVVVRVAATLEGGKRIGHDLATWIGEGLVDTVIAMPVGGDYSSSTTGLREIAELGEVAGVPVLAGIDSHDLEQSAEVQRAGIVNAYAAGARGILYHHFYPLPQIYPYTPQETDRLRYLAYPDIVAHQDKTFRVGPSQDRPRAASYGLAEPLPHDLVVGEPVQIQIQVADDIAAKAAAGELWRCELRLMLVNFMQTDQVALKWNGAAIPPERIRMADWTFQMRPSSRERSYRFGYRVHADLKDWHCPQVGVNELSVELTSKDGTLVAPVTLADVDLVVEYLPHRNALRRDETHAGTNG